jgi:RecB family endonuclease NucS
MPFAEPLFWHCHTGTIVAKTITHVTELVATVWSNRLAEKEVINIVHDFVSALNTLTTKAPTGL